jgi:hypothetical protein
MKFRAKWNNLIGDRTLPIQEKKAKKGSKKPVLAFTLKHGDIVIMHGSGIHRFYEVCTALSALNLERMIN